MPSEIKIGEQIQVVDIFDLLPPVEGEINIYYGRIGSGKTSAGTKNIFNELKKGRIVYSNWKIDWNGYDQRNSWLYILLGTLGLKREFFYYPPTNLHFWNFVKQEIDGKPCPSFIDQLSKMTDCSIHLDEGHIPFDSYEATRMSEKKRSAVFATRHFDRSLTIYTQRANSVHVNLRGNSNRFFKCEKIYDFKILKKRFILFQVTEFQDLTAMGGVDETRLKDEKGNETGDYLHAVSQIRYWGTKKLFTSFDSKYLREGTERSQTNYAELFKLKYGEIFKLIANKFKKEKKEGITLETSVDDIPKEKEREIPGGERGVKANEEKRSNFMDKNTWKK